MQNSDLNSITEARWKIASDFAGYLPNIFDEEMRKISQGRCDAEIKEAELNIWKDAGKKQKRYAKEFNCSLSTAKDVAEAFSFFSGAIFGPGFQNRITEEKNDIAKITIFSCPILKIALERGADTRGAAGLCKVFSDSAIEGLNPAYRPVVQKNMCNGDHECEVLIVKK
ncbi:MAG: hypothetical protein JXQ82_08430 [Methanomicrobiaceae archaeon]|nr:hypothetical protein [Methanomicrobiaceae archaeon]